MLCAYLQEILGESDSDGDADDEDEEDDDEEEDDEEQPQGGGAAAGGQLQVRRASRTNASGGCHQGRPMLWL